MKKLIAVGGALSLLFLTTTSSAEMQQQPQNDSMKHDTMSQDTMSNDKMPNEMAKAELLKGWVTDSECAAHGEKQCGNKEHLTHGGKLVIVTDGDNKIWTVANPDRVAEHQGHHVQVKATKDIEKGTVKVQYLKMVK